MYVKIRKYPSWQGRIAEWFPNLYQRYYDWRQSRRVTVRIDSHDTWDLTHTLAVIILPALKQFRAEQIGAPKIDNEDVPENLHMSPEDKEAWDNFLTTDENWFKRNEYVLDEMIAAFEIILSEEDDDFYKLTLEEHKVLSKRAKNGLRLFGKYYRSLWI